MGIGPFRVVVREALPTRPEVRHYGEQISHLQLAADPAAPGARGGTPPPAPRRSPPRWPPPRSSAPPPSAPRPGPLPARARARPARPAPLTTRSVVERWTSLPDMIPSASSWRQDTAGRAPPPSSPAASAPRASRPTEGGGRGGPASHPADRMGPARRSSRGAESGAPATPAEGGNPVGRGGSGPGSRARARAPARRSPDFPAARAAPRQVLRGPLTPRPRAAGCAA